MSFSQIQKMNTQSFEESEEFSKMVESYMYDVQEKLYLQNLFESDGAYNPKKLVDVMELSKKERYLRRICPASRTQWKSW